ncbi:MAG: helix-turn-helix transcriptional regulator [Fuerstiella sp.]
MSAYEAMPDAQIEAILCSRMESIRLNRNITQADLAREAGVSTRTIRRMEQGEGISLATFIRVLKAFKLLDRLDLLLPPEQVQPIERVQKAARRRERASGKRKRDSDNTHWTWGDE